MVVWLKEQPDGVVAVLPVQADYGSLRVRPYYFLGDMPVQFTGE